MGQSLLYFNDNVKALDDFNSIIRIKPYLSEPYFFRGLAKLNLSDNKGAEGDFSQAISLNPNYFHAYAYRGMSYSRMGNYNRALNDFAKAISLDPTSSYVYANRGLVYISLNKLELAEKDFSKSLFFDNESVFAYLNRAIVREKLGNIDGAFVDCNSAIRLNVFSGDAFRLRGYLYYQQKDYYRAIEDYNKGLKAVPDDVDLFMSRAMTWYADKKYTKALDDYDKVVEIDSNNIFAYYNRALLRGEIGATNGAIEDLNKVIEMNDNNILVYFNRALYKIEIKDWYGAYDDLTESIDLYPDFAKAYMVRSMVSMELNDNDEADKDRYLANEIIDRYARMKGGDKSALIDTSMNFQRLVDLNSNNDNFRDVISGKMQNRRAIIDLKNIFYVQYISLDSLRSAKAQYYSSYIMDYNQKHNYNPALIICREPQGYPESFVKQQMERLTQLIESKEGDNNNSYLLRAGYYMSENKFFEAIQDFDEIISVDENNLFAIFNRANVYVMMLDYIESISDESNKIWGDNNKKKFQQIDYSKAIVDYDRCLSLAPDFVYAIFNKANLFAKNGEIEKAIELYSEVIEKDKELGEAYFNRGLLYIYMGRQVQAGMDLSKAGELGLLDAYNIIKYYIDNPSN